MTTLQQALDDAVVAYRDHPTHENRERLMWAMEVYHEDFLRRERDEALARGIEIYTQKEK
jgi:hypothetical protein